jgi:hypothetical protein
VRRELREQAQLSRGNETQDSKIEVRVSLSAESVEATFTLAIRTPE